MSIASARLHLDVEETTGPCILDKLGGAFDVLAGHLDVPLTGRRPWLSAWIAAYPHYRPWAISAWDTNTLIGAGLLAYRTTGSTVDVVALGQGRNDRSRPLVPDQRTAELLAERVALSLEHCDKPWTLNIEQLPPHDLFARALMEQLPQGLLVPGGSVPGIDFAQHTTPDEHLSKNLRRQLQKSCNRIDNDGLQPVIAFTRLRSRLRDQLDEIESVHRNRDHDAGRTSDIDDPDTRTFWRNLITTHIDRDDVEIATFRLDGALAAYVISFLDQSTYRVFDGRFETHWARYSPGRLLEVATLAHAMTDPRFHRLDWMNSIAPDKLISANTLEATSHLSAASFTH